MIGFQVTQHFDVVGTNMTLYSYPALITCLALLLYFWTLIGCGLARRKYQVKAPAIMGHPDFERRFRIQQNTLEQLLLFIPSLWVFSVFVSPTLASIPGFVFLLGRLIYAISYARNPDSRGLGFAIGTITSLILLIGGLIGVIKVIVADHL